MNSEYRKGFVLTLLGVLIFTPDALLIRLTNLDFFSLTVGRGTIAGLAIFLGLALYYRRDFKKQILAIGGWGLVLAFLQGSFTWAFYGALMNTSVANVLVFFASMPLIAALMSKIFLHEQVQKATWTAIGVVVLGLLIVGSRGLIVGNWLGDFLALMCAVIMAGFFTIVRGRRAVNLIPATGFGLLLAALVASPLAVFPEMSSSQWVYLIVGAGFVVPIACALLTLGPRYIPAPEAAMLNLLETVLGPLWVWLVISEQPDANTIIGGAIVVGALFLHALWRMQQANTA
jgi:drug/metabolite transporter (DMT)-like permease